LAHYGGPIPSSHLRWRVSAAGGSAGSASSRAASSSAAGGVGNLLWNSGRTLLPGMMQFFFCSLRGFSSSPTVCLIRLPLSKERSCPPHVRSNESTNLACIFAQWIYVCPMSLGWSFGFVTALQVFS
jgi:hypothetical protein